MACHAGAYTTSSAHPGYAICRGAGVDCLQVRLPPEVNRILYIRCAPSRCATLSDRRQATPCGRRRVAGLPCVPGPLSLTSLWALRGLIRNLPYKITAEEMYDVFGKYGAIRQIRLGNAATTRGKAYVVYEDIFDAKQACDKLSGFNIGGRYLVVLYYQAVKVGGPAGNPSGLLCARIHTPPPCRTGIFCRWLAGWRRFLLSSLSARSALLTLSGCPLAVGFFPRRRRSRQQTEIRRRKK